MKRKKKLIIGLDIVKMEKITTFCPTILNGINFSGQKYNFILVQNRCTGSNSLQIAIGNDLKGSLNSFEHLLLDLPAVNALKTSYIFHTHL